MLEQILFDFLKLFYWVDNEKCKIRVFFIFTLPILQRLYISFFVHILATLSQFLVVNDIYIRALFSLLFHSSRIFLQSSYDELFIALLLKSESQQRNFFCFQKTLNKTMSTLPFLLIKRLKNNSILRIGDENLVFKLPLFHTLKERNITNSRTERTDVDSFFIFHWIPSIHRFNYTNHQHQR